MLDVVRRDFRADLLDVTGRQGAAIMVGQAQPGFLAMARHQLLAQAVAPVVDDLGQAILEHRHVDADLARGGRVRADDDVQLRQR